MLPRAQRLSTTDFNVAFEKGRVGRHRLLQLRVFYRNDGKSTVRTAFVTPKKLGKATVRNRLRRRIREIYRLLVASQEVADLAGSDLIFLAGAAAGQAENSELQAALTDLMKRAASLDVKGARSVPRPQTGSGQPT